MEALLLSRWQFAITTVYHFLFVPLTLGLSFFVALLETCYVNTTHPQWKSESRKLVKFFGTLFLINFAMGVVTGIVQEFHFGMNWSEYSRFMGDIFGAPLALEALSAFFLESTFLGIWMFGWDKLSPKLHCACIWIVAIGSNLSAFWILVANSFMQHPVGYVLRNGRAEMDSFFALVTNHYVIGEYLHAFFSGMSTAGFLLVAVCAWKIAHDEVSRHAFSQALKGATVFMFVGLLGVMGSGHLHTQYVASVNPMKISAVEALWETEKGAPFAIVADVNQQAQKNDFEIAVPGAFSFMLYNDPSAEVKGINQINAEYSAKYGGGDYRPDVTALFWSFRIMIGLGGLMILIALVMGYFAWMERPLAIKPVLKVLPFLLPVPFLANSAGWFVAEAGRQPWIVVGLQRTADAVSPNLTAVDVWLTLIGFTVLYLLLIIAALGVACKYIKRTQVADEGRNA